MLDEIEVVAYDPASARPIRRIARAGRGQASPSFSAAAPRPSARRSWRSSAATGCSGIPRSTRSRILAEHHLHRRLAEPEQLSARRISCPQLRAADLSRRLGLRLPAQARTGSCATSSGSYGGEIVGEIYVPMETPAAKLRSVLAASRTGRRRLLLHRRRPDRRRPSTGSIPRPASTRCARRSQPDLVESEVREIGPELCEAASRRRPISARSTGRPAGASPADFHEEFGADRPVSMWSAGAYAQASLFDGIERAGTPIRSASSTVPSASRLRGAGRADPDRSGEQHRS